MKMTCLTRMAATVFILCPLTLGLLADARAASLFSGLIIAQSQQRGVKVVEVRPDSPSGKAGIKVADVIIEIGGEKVLSLDDFVAKSRGRGKKIPEIRVKVLRKGKLLDFVIASYSVPIYQAWKIKAVEPPYTSLGGVSLFQYWVGKGDRELAENKQEIPVNAKILNYREAIGFYYFALHYSPTSVTVGLKLGDAYKDMAELYQSGGSLPEAVRSYGMAAEIYDKSSRIATKQAELEKILAGLQNVEERLFMLLPQEE